MTPTVFSHEIVSALCPCGIKTEVRDRDWIEHNRLVGLLTSSRGSCEPPVFIQVSYCGGPPEEKPVCLIGKSTTFDAGGLCIKKASDMKTYRADMSGGACVIAAIRAAAMLSLPINVTGIVAACENLPSGMAMRVGDIIKFNDGNTVEIERTDAEGHLIIADCLIYAQQKVKPRLIVDITTMTKGVRHLLGDSCVGTFSNSEFMWKQMRKAGVITGDRCWRLPIWKHYKRKVNNYTYVDLNNRGLVNTGTACLGAAFLSSFVDCIDWMHLDTRGTGMTCQNKVYPYYTEKLMTGRPTRTLIQFLYQLACPNSCDMPM